MGKYDLGYRDESCAALTEKVPPVELKALIGSVDNPGGYIHVKYLVHTTGVKRGCVSVTFATGPDFEKPITPRTMDGGLTDFVKHKWPGMNKLLNCDFGASCLKVYPQKFAGRKRLGPYGR